jgi:hypothetical protein
VLRSNHYFCKILTVSNVRRTAYLLAIDTQGGLVHHAAMRADRTIRPKQAFQMLAGDVVISMPAMITGLMGGGPLCKRMDLSSVWIVAWASRRLGAAACRHPARNRAASDAPDRRPSADARAATP